jgi:hypothetical protein
MLVYSNLIPVILPKIIFTISFWIMAILFVLNTLGNIISKNKYEKIIFTPVTILLTLLMLILIFKEK